MEYLRISGPADSKANLEIVTVADLKAYRKDTGTGWDTVYGHVVDGINRAIYRRLRGRFLKATGTPWDIVLNGPYPGEPLALPFKPVVTFTSLASGYYGANGWEQTYAYQASEYIVENSKGLVTVVGTTPLPYGRRQVRVVYESGFSTLPPDVVLAAKEWMSVEFERAKTYRLDKVSDAFEGGSTAFTFTTLPAQMAQVLDPYMRKDTLV